MTPPPPPPPRSDWHPLTKLLHWLIALLIVSMAVIGLSMGSMTNGPDKIAIYALHKSLGITLLALVLVRIGWRLRSGSPAPEGPCNHEQRGGRRRRTPQRRGCWP